LLPSLPSQTTDPEVLELMEALKNMLTHNPGKHGSWVGEAITVALVLPAIRDHPDHISTLPMREAMEEVMLKPLLVEPGSVKPSRRKEIIRDGMHKLGYELSFDMPLGNFCW
jgi:hypothetical protein